MIKQTTLQNILTWVIAVVLFIFQSLNYFIAWIKKYVIHGQKTTTVVTADTTISSESNLNNSNVPENVITVQGLIQKHFDIPLIIAEDEPKVYNFIKNAKLLTSNEICKEKTKIDQFMENLVDDSYVARGLGLITATVGRQSEFYLYSKYDKNFENIVIRLNGRNGEIGQITILSKNPENIVKPKSIPMDCFYDKDRIKVTYTPFAEGVYTLTLERNSLSICRSPYYISVEKSPTNSRSQIRLGTKKYKPVTKFAKSKNSSLDTCDNSIPVIEPNKPSICKNILPESEKNSIRTDVMSIVTKFESNSINFQKKVYKSTSSISEKESETNLVDDILKYPNIPPKIETDKVYDTYFSDLNSPSIHSKTISTDNNYWNDVDITYKNSKANDILNTIDFKSELIKKPTTKLNKCIEIKKDIPEVKNVSSTHLQPTNMVLVESSKIGNSHDVEKYNQTFKTIELMDENKHIEKHLDYNARTNDTEIKCIDDEPCIQNEVSCFDDEDRKTVVVIKNNNEIESNLNDTVIQQITDSAQYNINTPFTSVITKITNSICEKCSIEVLKIISEFPRDINIAHKNNSNEMRSSFETLLAQPINININIDNMFEHPIIATNEHDSENVLNISPKKIKCIGKIDKDIKCSYLNEIEPIDNNSDEQCDDINNMSKELMIKQNKDNSRIDKTLKDEIFDHCIVPFAEHTIDKHNIVHQNNELSTNEIMKIKYSTTNEENVLHSNQFNNKTIHKSDSKMEIQRQHLQKSSEHSIDLIKTNQLHENINEELNLISEESNEPLDTSDLITINNDKNTNYELIKDDFKIKNVIIPDENTNIQCSVINNIVLGTSEYKSEDIEEHTNNISYKNVTLTSIQNENQKLMIEKSIEPVLTSFKNKMVEKITQLYLNMDLSNTNNTSTFETHDKHLTNDLPEIKINKIANSTELNPKYIETVTSQLKNHIDKNAISEIILDQQKTDDNHLFKYVENIIKTKINPSGLYSKTLGEKKLQTLVNTAMNYQNDQQIDYEFKKMIIDNEIQDGELKKINDNEIVQDIETMLVETPNVKIIKNSDELILSKNEVTVKRQCKIPLINDFDSIKVEITNTDSKQEMETINVNENDKNVDTNAVEIKALQNFKKSYNTEIITPIIELLPTLETQIMNTSELVTLEEHSSKEIQTTSEFIDSINIPKETNAVENIDDNNEYKSVKLHFKENAIIKIPHLVDKDTLNKVVENISTNISAKSNSTENVSMQTEIESSGLKKVYSTNDITTESDTIYKLPSLNTAENTVNDKPSLQSIPTPNAQVSKNAAKLTIAINTSDPQFSNTAITVLIPSKLPTIEPIDSQSESDKNVNEMPIYTEAETPNIIENSTASTVCKIVVELVKNKNKTPIEELEIIVHEQVEEDSETVRKITSTMNSLVAVMDEQVCMKKYGSDLNYEKSNDYVTNTETKNKKSTGQNNADKYIEKESPQPISNLTGVGMENLNANIVTAIALTSCTNSSPDTVDIKTIAAKVIEEESPSPINSLVELLQKNINTNIGAENESLLPIESIKEPTIEDITEPEIISCTKSPTEMTDSQNHAEKIVKPKLPLLINSSDKVIGENTNLNIDTGNETLLPIGSTMKSIGISKEVEDINETEKIPCTNSSTKTEEVKTVAEKVIEEESPSPNNSLVELLQKNINTNIGAENESLLPIESIKEPTIEDITEPEIISCTKSPTEMTDSQNHAEKIVEPKLPLLINSSDKVIGENTNLNIDTENETLLPIGSTMKSIGISKEVEDINETEKIPCTNSSTKTEEVKTVAEKVIEEESPSPNNSLVELLQKNINTNIGAENESLLPIESIKEPTIEDITEPEIISCTKSPTEMTDSQNHAEKIVEPKLPLLINSSDKVIGENTNLNIDTENETLLPIGSTMKSIGISKEVEDINETEKIPCTNSSTKTEEVKSVAEKVIEEESPSPNNSLVELLQKNINTNIGAENESLLPIESIKEPTIEDITEPEIISCTKSPTEMTDSKNHAEKIVEPKLPLLINSSDIVIGENTNLNIDTENETLLPIGSTMKSIGISKEVEDINETEKIPCTNSSTKTEEVKSVAEKVIEEESPSPNNSLIELLQKNINTNIGAENESLLPIESIKEPTIEDITEPEIISCTKSPTEMTDSQNHAEKIVEPKLPLLINSSDKVIGENTNLNIDTGNETLLPIGSTMKSIGISKEVEDINETEKIPCTNSSTKTEEVKTVAEKVIEEESPSPNNSLVELLQKNINTNIGAENESLLPIESIKEPTIEDITEPEIISCTKSPTEMTDSQNHAEKIVEPKLPLLINSSDKVIGENTNLNIDTGNETLLPIGSTMKSIGISKEVEDINETEKIPCTNSSTKTEEVKTVAEKVIEEESPSPNNSLVELLQKNINTNIGAENESLLPIESIKEPTIEDITEPEIISCTKSPTEMTDSQNHAEKIVEPKLPLLINSSDKVIGENTNLNIDTENETLLPIGSTMKSIGISKEVEDINETEKIPCTNSSTKTEEVKTVAEKVIEEESPSPNNSLVELLQKNINTNIGAENESLLPIESIKEPTIEDITEPEIISCTKSPTEMTDSQNHAEKIVEPKLPLLINSSDKVIGENTNLNIDTENETLLPIGSTMKSIGISKEVEDINETEKIPCTNSSTKTEEVKSVAEKVIEEESPSPNNSLVELLQKNINTNIGAENESLLPIESIKEPTIEDITEPEIISCTKSPTEMTDSKNHAEKIVEPKLPLLINSSDIVIGENTNLNIDTENETLLPIGSTMKSIGISKEVEDINETEKIPCTNSSTKTEEVKSVAEKVIEEESPSPNNSLIELLQKNINTNIGAENESLLPIESIKEPTIEDITEPEIISCTKSPTEMTDSQNHAEKIVEPKLPLLINSSDKVIGENTNLNIDTGNETLLPIGSTMKSIGISKEVEDINETEKIPCTNSSTKTEEVKTVAEKVIEEESPSPNNSLVELLQKNINTNIGAENESLLPIESIKEPTIEDITEPEIISCTKSPTEMTDSQNHAEKIVEPKLPLLINSSDKVIGENTNLNIDTENETLLPIGSTMKSIGISKEVEDINETEKIPCTNSSTKTEEVKTVAEKVIEEESPSPNNSLVELLQKNINTNIGAENESLLPIESIKEPTIEDITEPEIISCTKSPTEMTDSQNHAEKIVEPKLPLLINSSDKVIGENTNLNIDTENETLLPIGSTMKSIGISKEVEDINETEKIPCTNSSTKTEEVKSVAEKVIEEESPSPNNSLVELLQKNINTNIGAENESLLPIESIKEPTIEDITEPEIISCTKSPTEMTDSKNHAEKIVEPKLPLLINSSDIVIGENTNLNIDTENETLLPIGSTMKSIGISKEVEDINETEKIPCTNSSTKTEEVKSVAEKVIEEESPSPNNSLIELLQKNINTNIGAENESLLPIESIKEPTIEDITEPEIISCTKSPTEMTDSQNHAEKIVEPKLPLLINSSDKVIGENTNLNIDTGNETLLPIGSTMKSIGISKEVEDINETEKIPCTNSSTKTEEVKTVAEKVIEEESPSPNNSLVELLQKNINTNIGAENESLLPIESIKEPTIEDITEPEIISCTKSPTEMTDSQNHAEKIVEPKLPLLINSSDKVVVENTNLNIDTENKTLLPIGSILESIEKSKVVEGIIATKIPYCTESSTEYFDMQIGPGNVHVESFPTSTNVCSEILGEKIKDDVNTESETLLPINNYVEEKKVREEIYETLIPIESEMELIQEPKLEEDIIELKIASCTDSTPVVIQKDTEKAIEEKSSTPINSLGEEMEKNMNVNIDTKNEIVLPINSIIGPMEEKKEKNGLNDPLLTMKSTIESIKEPNEDEDITITELTTCTNSLSIILETKMDVKKVIKEVNPVLINNSLKIIEEKMKVNMDTEYENILPIKATIESIEKPKVVEDITETEITSCTEPIASKKECIEKNKMEPTVVTETEILSYTESSTIIDNYQNQTEKIDDEVQINYLGNIIGESINVNIVTENKTHLPIGSTMESVEEPSVVEDITETEIKSCTESSTEHMMDAKTNNVKYMAEKSPAPINCSVEKVGGKSKVNINLEDETPLPINLTMEYIAIPKTVEIITETKISSCIDSCILTINAQTDVEKRLNEVILEPLNGSGEEVAKKTNMNIDTGNETILPIKTSTFSMENRKVIEGTTEITLPIESTMEFKKKPKLIEDTTATEIIACTDSLFVIEKTKIDVENMIEEAPPVLINSSDKIIREITKVNMDREYETILPIETTDITETEITASSTANMMGVQINKEKYMAEKFPVNSSVEEVGENTNMNIDTEYETILPIESKIESITETKILLCIDSSTDNLIVKTDVDKVIEEESTSPINFSGELVHENMNINISTENETLLSMKSIEEPKVEYITEPEITSCTEFSTEIIDNQYHAEKIVDEVLNNSLSEVIGENMNKEIVTVSETLLSIGSNNESILESATELKGYEKVTNKETETLTLVDTLNTTVDRQTVKENFKEIISRKRIATSTAFEEEQKSVEPTTVIENVLSVGTYTASEKEEKQVEEVIKNKSATLISYSTIHDVASLEEPKIIKNETSAMKYSVTAMEEQMEVAAAEVVINTYKDSLDKTMIEKGTHNETPTPIDILVTVTDKQIDLDKVAENEIPILVNTSTESVEKQIITEKVIENETITQLVCETMSKIETNEFEEDNENETSTPINNSVLIAIKQTEVDNLTERTLQNDDIVYKNTKTNFIGRENKTENSDNPKNVYLKFGETSKINRLENEDNLQRKSYGIQKLEMSVQRTMKTSDEDYYEKTFVQLEQTEQISKVDNVDSENKTVIDDKLYTVNESDLNAILCASSLEEALTLLDSKIKFKFKRKKSSSKINSAEYSPKIQTSDVNSSGVNTNFTDAREFFKEIEKKSKK